MEECKIGDLVVLNEMYATSSTRGRIYRVTEILKVNVVVKPVGGGQGLRGKPYQFDPAPETSIAAVANTTYMPTVYCGEVVTIAGPGWKQSADALWVVIKENADRKVKVARLGGDKGRYWTVPRAMLTQVDVKRINLTPAESEPYGNYR